MNLHEYQGKDILRKYNVPVPDGKVAFTAEEAVEAAKEIQKKTGCEAWAVKAQIHAGGRGKGGGVKIAKSLDEVQKHAGAIIGMTLVTPQTGPRGKKVHKILVEQGIYYKGESEPAEFYLSFLLNRQVSKSIIIYSPAGGMSIEEVAHNTPHLIFREAIDPLTGLQPFQCRRVAFNLGLKGKAWKNFQVFLPKLFNAYESSDASLFEINPLFKTSDHKIIAADCKVTLDDNALFRHPDYEQLSDITEQDPIEVEANNADLNYVKLDGNVGCMVNGAGLAMATMDIIKLSGGDPANFLDVGGTADPQRVETGFRIILKDPNVKAILVNIFGGIVRCDRVAQGIVDAYKNIGAIPVPIIVRLQGTNAAEARKIINDSGLKVHSAILLREAAEKVKEILS